MVIAFIGRDGVQIRTDEIEGLLLQRLLLGGALAVRLVVEDGFRPADAHRRPGRAGGPAVLSLPEVVRIYL
ncbi:MAG: hypothetical protein ABSG86_25255 [Thermoguttaceae bacterium]|jgi:hypothetical protein